MRITDSFTKAIEDTFYDKELTLMVQTESVNDFGETIISITPGTTTITGNVRQSNLQEVREDYGIHEEIDIAITTNDDVELGSILSYNGQNYRMTSVREFDSHNLLVGSEWSSNSLT